jgi:hypothetical protein
VCERTLDPQLSIRVNAARHTFPISSQHLQHVSYVPLCCDESENYATQATHLNVTYTHQRWKQENMKHAWHIENILLCAPHNTWRAKLRGPKGDRICLTHIPSFPALLNHLSFIVALRLLAEPQTVLDLHGLRDRDHPLVPLSNSLILLQYDQLP